MDVLYPKKVFSEPAVLGRQFGSEQDLFCGGWSSLWTTWNNCSDNPTAASL